MTRRPVPIKHYVEARTLKQGVPAILCLASIVAALSLWGSVKIQLSSDESVLRSVSRHLGSLISIEDRPEVNRLLESIAKERRSELWVVKGERVYGTSGLLAELDRPPTQSTRSVPLGESSHLDLSSLRLVTRAELEPIAGGDGRATLFLSTPGMGVLLAALWVTVGMTILAAFMGYLFTRVAARSASRALQPIGELANAISRFSKDEHPEELPSTAVSELETIRNAINQTHKDLVMTREALASSKARAVVGEVYGSVLHDLGGLSLSMRRIAKTLRGPDLSAKDRLELIDSACNTGEDIVRTIESGKSLLEIADPVLALGSLQDCISSFVDSRTNNERLRPTKLNLPPSPILVAHDPVLIHRALENLLANAHQHARSEVTLSLATSDRSVSIEIADDGPGMSQENLTRYLKGKGRSSHDRRPAFGLLSTQHIVRTHGARLIYRASRLGGALFEIRFQREAALL